MFQAYAKMWKNYAVFSGRAKTSDYWYPFLVNVIIGILYFILVIFLSLQGDPYLLGILRIPVWFYGIASFLPGLGLCVRRLHDTGRSGAYVLCSLIPLVGGILLIVWLADRSQPFENQYGENPNVTETHEYY